MLFLHVDVNYWYFYTLCIITTLKFIRSNLERWDFNPHTVPTKNYHGRTRRFSPSSKLSRLALESTLQPRIQWVPGLFSWAFNSQGVQLTTPSGAKVRNDWGRMSPPPVSLQGMDRYNFVFVTPSFEHYHTCVISENYGNCYLFVCVCVCVCVCIGVNIFFSNIPSSVYSFFPVNHLHIISSPLCLVPFPFLLFVYPIIIPVPLLLLLYVKRLGNLSSKGLKYWSVCMCFWVMALIFGYWE